MNQNPTAQEIKKNLEEKLSRYFGCTPTEASREQIYKATAMTVRDLLTDKRGSFKKEVNRAGAKRVYNIIGPGTYASGYSYMGARIGQKPFSRMQRIVR